MSNEVPSRQEMFTAAWNGLKSQGWVGSINDKRCVYFEDGRRCAWGWVDLNLIGGMGDRTVRMLHRDGIGVAARLSEEDVDFADQLQVAHDTPAQLGTSIEVGMRDFAAKHGLTIPDEEA